MFNFRSSTLAVEGPLKISQAIKIPLLLDIDEWRDLFSFLKKDFPLLAFYNTHGVCEENGGILTLEDFLSIYSEYISILKDGKIPSYRQFCSCFSSALSATPEIFYKMELEGGKRLIKPVKPPIQLQTHEVHYSEESGAFYSMAYSENSISFGIQFSYPNLFQDPHTHDVMDVDSTFPNTSLFANLRKWVRAHTSPTPFIVKGQRMNLSYRLGKQCFSWIENHPQLKEKKITLYVASGKQDT